MSKVNNPSTNEQQKGSKVHVESIDPNTFLSAVEDALEHPDAIDAFIESRLSTLTEKTKPTEISHIVNSQYSDFIHPDSTIVRNYLVDRLHVNDKNLYRILMDTLLEMKEGGWGSHSVLEMIPTALQYTLGRYFGNFRPTSSSESENREFYHDGTTADSTGFNVSDFRGKKFAVCAEKAPAAHNMLKFLGFKSTLIAASGCVFDGHKDESAHYYLAIQSEKGFHICDPTNPSIITDKETNVLKSCSHGMHAITTEQYNDLLQGGQVSVQHVDATINEDGNKEEIVTTRVYVGTNL